MKTTRKKGTLIHTLLTEDRYWTFWAKGWTKKLRVTWNGKTKFAEIIKQMEEKLGDGMMYERQIEVKEPDFTFA